MELTPQEVVMLIEKQVDALQDIVRSMHSKPIRSKQEALPKLQRINELLALIPNPSNQSPPEIDF